MIVRNCSWPAVSQIWSLTFLPPRCTVLILKSIPIVVMNVEEKVSLAYLNSRLVLPTALSPIMSSLIWRSYGRLPES